MKKSMCFLLSFGILASNTVICCAEKSQEEFPTRGQAAGMILYGAADYNKEISLGQLLQGYGNGIKRTSETVTRAEAYVMLDRAFGPLPEPKGDLKRRGSFEGEFTDVPQWAVKEVGDLQRAGLLMEQGAHQMEPGERISKAELSLMIKRIYAYLGQNVKDDAFNTVNREWLLTADIPDGKTSFSAFDQLELKNDQRIMEIIQDCIKKGKEASRDERNIGRLYQSYMAKEMEETLGITPLTSFMKAVDQAESMDELFSAEALLEDEFGMIGLLPWMIVTDARDSSKYRLACTGLKSYLTKSQFSEEDLQVTSAYKELLTGVLCLMGESEGKAKKEAEQIYQLEKQIAKVSLNAEELDDVDKTYHPYEKGQFESLFAGVNMEKALKELKLDGAKTIIVYDEAAVKKLASLLTDKNLKVWKAKLKVDAILDSQDLLGEEYSDLYEAFEQRAYGVQGTKTEEQKAIELVKSSLPSQMGKLYVARYFSKEEQADVTNIIQRCIDVFKERLKGNPWMSEKTKRMAIKKLNHMKVNVGYPKKWSSTLDSVEMKSGGDHLFDNVSSIKKTLLIEERNKIDGHVRTWEWELPVYQVNAFYTPSANEITFPAGILQAPFYDGSRREEANLGGIGTVIAHEITHAFDNNGAKYDEKGSVKNWWTKKDQRKFKELCEKVEKAYNGLEVAPGIGNNGKQTVSENVADLGGVACALETVKKLKNPDYRLFFETFIRLWPRTMGRQGLKYYQGFDVHSFAAVRANRTLQNFQEFFDTYGIRQGDGMYVAPQDRISIW